MLLGTSLRFIFASSEDSLRRYHETVVAKGEFSDIPLGVTDARVQARQLLEIARTAAEHHFGFLMVGDSHASSYANAFAPTPTLARMLAVTGDMPVGLLYLAPFHHPVIAAEQVGTLAAFAPEPLTLVVGNGDVSEQFTGFRIAKGSRGRRSEEFITVVRALLAGETVTHEGEFFQLDDVRINPVPAVPAQIWVAATAGGAVDRAGRLGDAWETAPGTSPEELRVLLDRYRAVCAEHGRVPDAVLRRDIYVAETDEQAWEAVEPMIAAGYRGFGHERDTSLVGSAGTVVKRLAGYRDMGFEKVLVRHIVGDHQQILDSLRRIGDDVIPAVADL